MTDDEAIDEALNKAINEALGNEEINDDEIKRRKPKPFRYITDENEIREELEIPEQKTVMREPDQPNITNDEWFVLGMGDMDTVESVIKRHQQRWKSRHK